jgi:hypothetical protein
LLQASAPLLDGLVIDGQNNVTNLESGGFGRLVAQRHDDGFPFNGGHADGRCECAKVIDDRIRIADSNVRVLQPLGQRGDRHLAAQCTAPSFTPARRNRCGSTASPSMRVS